MTVDLTTALERSVAALTRLQHPDGWWKGELQTNVTMDAEDLLMREFIGARTEEQTRLTATWLRSQQRSDGTWATFYEGPGDLSTTVEAYWALRLAGDAVDEPHMLKAAQFVRDAGGVEASRVFTRLWMALFGLWSWDDLPALPPEVVLLPRWVPLNVYDFACWARQTVVALTVVGAHRPAHPLPFDLDELRTGAAAPVRHHWRTPAGRFERLDAVLRRYERRPIRRLRRHALRRAERWIVDRQEADGGWGGIQPPWVYSIIALHLLGYPNDHPVMAAALAGLEGFTIVEDDHRRLEACQSPVWDTAFAVQALADAGVPGDDDRLLRAGRWLLDEEITVPGDWSVRRPHLAPGGWAFEFANDCYPDIDDTAEVVLALRRTAVGAPGAAGEAAVHRGIAWTEGMQCRDGGYAAFDVDNVRQACRDLPFCDFGEVIDPPSADVTAHVVEMLAAEPGADPVALRRAVDWLWAAQETDGSWFGRWGVNYVYGTGAAVPALVAAGAAPSDARLRRAVRWLEEHQNPDGGWGEDLRSYVDESWRGRGASTASQTGWALLALLALDERTAAVERGLAFLVDTQRPDGTWDEPWFTGTGFPWDFSINYHLYRQVFPTMALGRAARTARAAERASAT
jgi:squalene-hopene/tetraprenyl-beta-curcumene cyclase